MTNALVQGSRDDGFVMGLIAGGIIGVGLAMYFAPRATAELRTRVGSARSLADATAERFQRASTRDNDAVDKPAKKGQDGTLRMAGTEERPAAGR